MAWWAASAARVLVVEDACYLSLSSSPSSFAALMGLDAPLVLVTLFRVSGFSPQRQNHQPLAPPARRAHCSPGGRPHRVVPRRALACAPSSPLERSGPGTSPTAVSPFQHLAGARHPLTFHSPCCFSSKTSGPSTSNTADTGTSAPTLGSRSRAGLSWSATAAAALSAKAGQPRPAPRPRKPRPPCYPSRPCLGARPHGSPSASIKRAGLGGGGGQAPTPAGVITARGYLQYSDRVSLRAPTPGPGVGGGSAKRIARRGTKRGTTTPRLLHERADGFLEKARRTRCQGPG
jgi:hypothetical protein